MDIRTFVKQTQHSPTYCVVTRDLHLHPGLPVLHGPKYVTKIHPCYVAGDINYTLPTLPIPNHDGGSMTQPEAMLLHMSTVNHVLTNPTYNGDNQHA